MVAGVRYEEVQCFLGGVDHQKAVDEELERLTDSQKSVMARLLEFKTSDALRQTLQKKALQKSKLGANRKAALSGEALEEKLKARNETNEELSAGGHTAKRLLKVKLRPNQQRRQRRKPNQQPPLEGAQHLQIDLTRI